MKKQALMLSLSGERMLGSIYQPETMDTLKDELDFLPSATTAEELAVRRNELRNVSFIFSTWGMPSLSEDELADIFPSLEAVFYGAGTVQTFARPALNRGARVYSAAIANGTPVAEFTVAQIILANKGYFRAVQLYKSDGFQAGKAFNQTLAGNYNATIGLLGAGVIGRQVIQMLKAYKLTVLVFDPFLSEADAHSLGVEKADLDEIFSRSDVVSNHLANNAQTQGILNYSHFSRMRSNATFINTGRGAQIVEADLLRAMREEPGRTALIDVTFPEPIEEGSPWWELPNVYVSPHIAGSTGQEVARMGEFMLSAYKAYATGQPFAGEVTEAMLATMA